MLFSIKNKKLILLASIISIILSFLISSYYMSLTKKNFYINLGFFSDSNFSLIELKENKNKFNLELSKNINIKNIKDNKSAIDVIEEKEIKLSDNKYILKFENNPDFLDIYLYRKKNTNPYYFSIFSFISQLKSVFIHHLNSVGWGITPYYEIISVTSITDINSDILEINLLNDFIGIKSNFISYSYWLTFTFTFVIHFFIFYFSLILLLSLKEKDFFDILKDGLFISFFTTYIIISTLFYYYKLNTIGAVLNSINLYLAFIIIVLETAFLYATVNYFIFYIFPKRLKLIGFLLNVLLITLSIIQILFLKFTGKGIQSSFFNMVKFSLIKDVVGIWSLSFIFLFLVITCLIISKKRILPSPKPLLIITPFFVFISYLSSFYINDCFKKNENIPHYYNLSIDSILLSSNLESPLNFSREYLFYLLKKGTRNKRILNIKEYSQEKSDYINSLGFNLGEEISTSSLSRNPFKRIILLTIEGYRLEYIPQYNSKLKSKIDDFPFFSREEVKNGFINNYYASSFPTTNGYLSILTSHPNVTAFSSFSNAYTASNIIEYPSLPKLLKSNNYKTIFIGSAEIEFDNHNNLYSNLGFSSLIDEKIFKYVSEKDYKEAGIDFINRWLYPSKFLFKEILGILKENENIPLFLMTINTDTHSPPVGMGMTAPYSYGNLKYPDIYIDESIRDQYSLNVINSTYRFAYDLDNFYQELKNSDLWDEDTLLIITADHSYMSFNEALYDKGKHQLFHNLPFFFITPRDISKELSEVKVKEDYYSHLDLAPTILDILGINKPNAYWGSSLFNKEEKNRKSWFSTNPKELYSQNKEKIDLIRMDENPILQEIFETFYSN